jgi:hypothetical protein
LGEKLSIRRPERLIAAVVVIALSGALAGCSSSITNWDPTDLLDFLDTKKKLPGERKPVFPQGVPGLEQGVPKDLYKGANQQQEAPAVAAVQPVEQPKSKNAKGKGKQLATAPAQAPAVAPDGEAAPEEEGSTAAAPPAPKPKKIVRRRTTAPPPDPAAPQAAQPAAQPQQAGAPFPAPMPAGTFQR